MAHDVFISHSAKDKVTGDAICAMLESEGIRCWIAPRDVVPGMEWGECIIEAIEQTRIMVLIFTADANGSAQIRREVERAVNHGVVILPFRIENVVPGRALEYFIGNVHWMDALTPPLEAHLKNLALTIRMLLTRVAPRNEPMPHVGEGSAQQGTAAAAAAQPPAPVAEPVWEPPREARPPEPVAPPPMAYYPPKNRAPVENPVAQAPPPGVGWAAAPVAPQGAGTWQANDWRAAGGTVASPSGSQIPRWVPGAAVVGLAVLIIFGWVHYKAQNTVPAYTPVNLATLANTNLTSIFGVNDGHRLWIAGDGGTLLASDDDGKTWGALSSGASRNLNWIAGTSDGKRLWAVGDSGTIVRSTNSGASWQSISSGQTNDLYSVFAADDGKRVWIVGARGTLLASKDSGSTWQAVPSGTGMWLWAIRGTSNGTKLWAVGAWGTVVQTSDGGTNWRAQIIDSNENIHSLFATGDGERVWAVGNNKNIWESTDGGATWASKNSAKGEALLNIYGASGDAIWLLATGTSGTMLRSDHDDGMWSPLSSGASVSVNSIFGSSDGTYLWAVGNSGTVLKSIDGGLSWTK